MQSINNDVTTTKSDKLFQLCKIMNLFKKVTLPGNVKHKTIHFMVIVQ